MMTKCLSLIILCFLIEHDSYRHAHRGIFGARMYSFRLNALHSPYEKMLILQSDLLKASMITISMLFNRYSKSASLMESNESPAIDTSAMTTTLESSIIIPMFEIESIYYINYTMNGIMFRAIVDTGSPFLLVPTICTRLYGCPPKNSSNSQYESTDLDDTVEIYGGQDYDVKWKKGILQFVGSSSTDSFHSNSFFSGLINRNIKNEINYNINNYDDFIITKFNTINNFQSNVVEDSLLSRGKQKVIFASVGYDILLPPGGVFVGLIKEKSKDIRPTLLGQLGYNSIRFDTRSNYLTLSKTSLLASPSLSSSSPSSSTTKSTLDQSVIPLIDLRQYGDPVCHYAVQVRSLEINNKRIGDDNTTIYAIFDTGTSGCVLSDDIVNDYNTPNPIRQVGVTLLTEGGGDVYIQAKATRDNLFVVKANKITWFQNKKKRDDGYTSKDDGKGVSDNNYFVTTRNIDDDKYDENDNCLSYHDNDIIVNTKQDSVILDHDDNNYTDDADSRICRSLNDNPQIVVLGLAFFTNKILTIDTIACRLKLE